MKPVLIIDKSVLHMLSFEEIELLKCFYTFNIPDVLLFEILADIFKNDDYLEEQIKELQKTASKLYMPF